MFSSPLFVSMTSTFSVSELSKKTSPNLRKKASLSAMPNDDPLHISDKVRTRHIYIAGKTRHGKSNLIFWMALQDIDQGKGVCVLDPHGDLVRKLIHYIP